MSPRTAAAVVVGVDGSPSSRLALAYGLWEAGRWGVPLRAVHAWQPRVRIGGPPADDRKQAEHLVHEEVRAALAQLVDPNGTRVTATTAEGDAGDALVAAAAGARLLVLGRSDRQGLAGAMLGSTVRYALHWATAPVMVLPDTAPPAGAATRVLVGYDGSPSTDALRWAVARACREQLALEVLHAWSLPHPPLPALPAPSTLGRGVQEWLERSTAGPLTEGDELPSRVEAVHGSPAEVLLSRSTAQDLLVVGARGRGGFHLLQLGSVALQLAEHAPCPVVVVR